MLSQFILHFFHRNEGKNDDLEGDEDRMNMSEENEEEEGGNDGVTSR